MARGRIPWQSGARFSAAEGSAERVLGDDDPENGRESEREVRKKGHGWNLLETSIGMRGGFGKWAAGTRSPRRGLPSLPPPPGRRRDGTVRIDAVAKLSDGSDGTVRIDAVAKWLTGTDCSVPVEKNRRLASLIPHQHVPQRSLHPTPTPLSRHPAGDESSDRVLLHRGS